MDLPGDLFFNLVCLLGLYHSSVILIMMVQIGLHGEALSLHSLSGSSNVEWGEASQKQPLTWYKVNKQFKLNSFVPTCKDDPIVLCHRTIQGFEYSSAFILTTLYADLFFLFSARLSSMRQQVMNRWPWIWVAWERAKCG